MKTCKCGHAESNHFLRGKGPCKVSDCVCKGITPKSQLEKIHTYKCNSGVSPNCTGEGKSFRHTIPYLTVCSECVSFKLIQGKRLRRTNRWEKLVS